MENEKPKKERETDDLPPAVNSDEPLQTAYVPKPSRRQAQTDTRSKTCGIVWRPLQPNEETDD